MKTKQQRLFNVAAEAVKDMLSRARGRGGPKAAALVEQGRGCLSQWRLVEAEAVLRRARRLRPDDVLAWKLLGWVAAEKGDWARAADHWRAVLRAIDDDRQTTERQATDRQTELAEALAALAAALIMQGDFAECGRCIDRLQDTQGGEGVALALRAEMAAARWDGPAIKAAWRDYHRRLPAQAEASLGWQRHRGGSDAAGSGRFTADDLGAATEPQTARRILAYLDLRLPRGDYLRLNAETAARFPDAADLQADTIERLERYLSRGGELDALQARVQMFRERFPNHPQGPRLSMLAAIAANDIAAVENIAAATGRDDLRLWLAAARGDESQARAIARETAKRYFIAEDRRGLDLALASRAPRVGAAMAEHDRILLFAAVRDERDFLPWFLDYYRALGVEWFFIVDNMSADDTAEYLSTQQDVTLFVSRDNYRAAASGMRWINELVHRYGKGNWCVFVDADEQLLAPGDGDLRAYVDGMAARGEEAAAAVVVDTLPENLEQARAFRPGDDPAAYSPFIDPDIRLFGKLDCCFFRARGGARQRLCDTFEMLEKTPILRGGAAGYRDSSHDIGYARASRQSCAILHHKILRVALGGRQPLHDDLRGDACRARHARYRRLNAAIPGPLHGRGTMRYENPDQLRRLGLLGRDLTPGAWSPGRVATTHGLGRNPT